MKLFVLRQTDAFLFYCVTCWNFTFSSGWILSFTLWQHCTEVWSGLSIKHHVTYVSIWFCLHERGCKMSRCLVIINIQWFHVHRRLTVSLTVDMKSSWSLRLNHEIIYDKYMFNFVIKFEIFMIKYLHLQLHKKWWNQRSVLNLSSLFLFSVVLKFTGNNSHIIWLWTDTAERILYHIKDGEV